MGYTIGTDVVMPNYSNIETPTLVGVAYFGLFSAPACFDDATNAYAILVDSGTRGGVAVQFSAGAPANKVGGYTLYPNGSYNADVHLCGSTDGSTWTLIDEQVGLAIAVVDSFFPTVVEIPTPTDAYNYYAISYEPDAVGQIVDFGILTGITTARKGRFIVCG
jgi:hypothetical protein